MKIWDRDGHLQLGVRSGGHFKAKLRDFEMIHRAVEKSTYDAVDALLELDGFYGDSLYIRASAIESIAVMTAECIAAEEADGGYG